MGAPTSSHSDELQRDGAPVDARALAESGSAGHAAAGLGDEYAIAELHGLPVETVRLWTERGGLREAFPGLYDIEDVAGRIHAAAKGGRR